MSIYPWRRRNSVTAQLSGKTGGIFRRTVPSGSRSTSMAPGIHVTDKPNRDGGLGLGAAWGLTDLDPARAKWTLEFCERSDIKSGYGRARNYVSFWEIVLLN